MSRLRVVTLDELQESALAKFSDKWVETFVEDGMLVVRVRSSVWWLEIYGPVGVPPRVDSEMAPHRAVTDAVAAHRELALWALGGAG